MRKLNLILVSFFFVCACKGKPAESIEPNRPGEAKPAVVEETGTPKSEPVVKTKALLMWEVQGKRPTYLFGTMHLGVNSEDVFPQIVWDRFDAADTLVLEADISDIDANEVMRRAQFPPDESLEGKLEKKEWETLVSVVGKLMPAPALKRFRPWFVMPLVAQAMAPPAVPMDLYFQNRARDAKRKLAYLEDITWQMELLEKVMTLEMLKHFLSDVDAQKREFNNMRRAYIDGDGTRLEAAFLDSEEMKKFPRLREVMIDKRNEAWVPKVEKYIASGNVFIAVGAAHFLGDKGLVRLLEEKGHKLKRVAVPGTVQQ